MREVKDITFCVVDFGLFLPVAERLARDSKRVLYHNYSQCKGFPTINECVVGDGLERVEHCGDFWPQINDIDAFVFPDVQLAGLQKYLESIGKPVWGSKGAVRLENNREYFLTKLRALGLDVPPYESVMGVTALRKVLRDKEECFIKVSKLRGSFETKKFRSWKLDENLIDLWAVRFGATREHIRFLVFDKIDTPLEIGSDTYCVGGQWPSLCLHGIEAKDMGYFSAVTPFDEMPEACRRVCEVFSPELEKERYANEFSSEIRLTDDAAYFIDPTMRGGLPSTGSQLELWKNFSEIVWAGANGELLNPESTAKFSAEVILTAKESDGLWASVEIPEKLKQWLKFADSCQVGEIRSFPREGGDSEDCGWLVAIGDTPTETLETLKEHIALLPDGLSTEVSPIAEIISQIEAEEKKGIEFSNEPLPEPGTVLEGG